MRLRTYRKGHLHHADGSLYMGRYGVFETKYLSCRIHHIATADDDCALHDHPWPFVSVVLRGGYTELLPRMPTPCWNGDEETTYPVRRNAGSVAFRGAACRHRVSEVGPGTWTMFVYFKWKQDWGFYTRDGKIFWRYYLDHYASNFSKENNTNVSE